MKKHSVLLCAASLLVGSAMAQTTVKFTPADAKFELNRHGQHVYQVGKYTMLFDPKTLTLSNPIRLTNTKVDAQVTQNADGSFSKTFSTDPVPGSQCPVSLSWKMDYNIVNTTVVTMLNGAMMPVNVQHSEQKGTWACGTYGGDTATLVVDYAPDLGVVVNFTFDMKYRGASNVITAQAAGINRPVVAQTGPTPVIAAKTE